MDRCCNRSGEAPAPAAHGWWGVESGGVRPGAVVAGVSWPGSRCRRIVAGRRARPGAAPPGKTPRHSPARGGPKWAVFSFVNRCYRANFFSIQGTDWYFLETA